MIVIDQTTILMMGAQKYMKATKQITQTKIMLIHDISGVSFEESADRSAVVSMPLGVGPGTAGWYDDW